MKATKSHKVMSTALLTFAVLASSHVYAQQGKGLDDPSRQPFKNALQGKTVAFVPVAMAVDLTQGWAKGMQSELEPYGVKIVIRDPNFSTQAGAQALTALISERPEVIVVHNPDITTYSKLIDQAEKAGIHVIQINMAANVKTAAYVGADWVDIGEMQAKAVVAACQGKSGKVAIVQGNLSAATSAYSLKGVENVFSKNPQIKVVSSQAADWEASKARAVTQTVLKQHPDICGIVGFWDGMDLGTAAAVKEAGLTGKVFVTTSGGGETKAACDQVKAGSFDLNVSYNVPNQAANLASTIKYLLSSGVKPGTMKGYMYTTLLPITKANASIAGTCWTLTK